ncbi:glutathione S-transferase family protein [Pseudomaricurvus alkylphenolicus]|uniref:glutathione S-transferase family protein n=1 Tax=Pseudomaricurvus alkylphenolicus TaxID=1306991 RepID=UPI00141E2B12|nr:glutathione binding-like protein [Pseudomaricurvus alkylphenolicus]NIB40411.1 glutathione S-transferase family protein [Pseudomaricurvus alkylphenolicus]
MSNPQAVKLYGVKQSYFTGKLEAYLRFKGIPFEFVTMDYKMFGDLIPRKTGASQMPALELPDGRWMTDTTPIIQWYEKELPSTPVIPNDPTQAFLCFLIEDYADEWLWRAAMHYRWSYKQGRDLVSTQLCEDMCGDLPVPLWLMRKAMARRQHKNFVVNDGVTKATWEHVESGYLRLLDILETIFSNRPFLLGERPSLADIGLFGPFFRHFGIDPNPAAIMREQAPSVYQWLARMWNAKSGKLDAGFVQEVPEDLTPLLREIAETHLELLCANAEAFQRDERRYGVTIQGVTYNNLITSRYRVWCLEKLRQKFQQLPQAAQKTLQTKLEFCGAWEPLWRIIQLESGFDTQNQLPFASGIEVFSGDEWDRSEKFVERIVNWVIQPKASQH